VQAPRPRIVAIALAAAAPAILAAAFIIGSTPDEEELRWGVLATSLQLRALKDATLLTWTSTMGFGIPAPMVPNFHMHPMSPLMAIMSIAAWARTFYVVHTIIGAIGVWKLVRTLQLRPITAAACVFTFLLATPTQNYALSDLWPSHYLMWTSAPWLLLLAWRLLEATGRELRRLSVLLGLIAGLVVANTHPGHVPVYAVIVVAVLVAQWRAIAARWPWLLVATAITAAIASPNLVQLATERRVFDPELGIIKFPEPLPPSALWDVFFRPYYPSEHPWQVDVVTSGTRTLFFGGPFALLALIGLLRFGGRHLGLAVGLVLTTVLLFTPFLPLTFVSRFHFRDPLILCASPLAGLAADWLFESRRTRVVASVLLAAQVVLVALSAVPFIDPMLEPDARRAMWLHGGAGEGPAADRLLALMPEPGRLGYSAQVDYEVSMFEGIPVGLDVNSLAYRGVPVVNGLFKGISTDVLWPDDRLFYGRIRLPRQLIESDEGLDVLGIRYVLANPGEAVAPGLRMHGSVPKSNGREMVLYENVDAPPGAIVISDQKGGLPQLAPYPDCVNDRLLCKDLSPLARLRHRDHVDIVRRGPHIQITVPAGTEPRMLVLAEMFRPEWKADGSLQTISVGPGLLGVRLPAGTTSVSLSYRSTPFVAASLLGWTVLVGAFAALLWLRS
jgi:hypothetical protein